MFSSNDKTTPSKEGGTPPPRNLTNVSSFLPRSSSSQRTSANALGSDDGLSNEEEPSEYETMLFGLTSAVVQACHAFVSPVDDEQLQKIVFKREGKYISREGGVETPHLLQLAGIHQHTPVIWSEYPAKANAELFAALYNQWKYWDERIEFTSIEQVSLAKTSKSSLMILQASIHSFDNKLRKAVSRELLGTLDIEKVEPFIRAQIFEWLSNKPHSHWGEHDFGREASSTLHQVQTGQGSTISMNRFPNQLSSVEARNSILVEKPNPPSASELNQKSAIEMIAYLRSVETNRLQPDRTLLNTYLDSELAGMVLEGET